MGIDVLGSCALTTFCCADPSTSSTQPLSKCETSSSVKSIDPSQSHDSLPVSLGSSNTEATALEVKADSGAAMSEGEQATLQAKATLAPSPAPGSRAHSPSPLLWADPSWSLGSFTFAPFNGGGESASSEAPSIESSQLLGAYERKSSLGSSDLNEPEEPELEQHTPVHPEKLVRDLCGTPCPDPKPARSKLVPTAEPFAPKAIVPGATLDTFPVVAVDVPASGLGPAPPIDVRTRPRPFPIDVHIRAARRRKSSAAPVDEDIFSPTSSPLEPCTPPLYAHVDTAQFDSEGRLVSHGAKYNIADEILQLQTTPLSPSFDQDPPHSRFPSYLGEECMHQRVASAETHLIDHIEDWRRGYGTEQSVSMASEAVPFPSMRSPASAVAERGRSKSLASSIGLDSPFRPALERSNTVAQLQSYFGPSSGNINVPLAAPAPLDVHALSATDQFVPFLGSSQELTRTPSCGSLSGGLGAPYPPLAHPEPFNLTPDDPLYVEARNIFVDSSCSSLAGPPTMQHRQTMAAHFDRAMHTLNPLASLYGLSQDAAAHLLADPENSGVNEVVLKVAAMRGRQQQMASVQRSAMGMPLPGPSPNNRKLNLYKTELCRSWEEKGSWSVFYVSNPTLRVEPKADDGSATTFAFSRYGVKCQFAHGIHELRDVARHPKVSLPVVRRQFFWPRSHHSLSAPVQVGNLPHVLDAGLLPVRQTLLLHPCGARRQLAQCLAAEAVGSEHSPDHAVAHAGTHDLDGHHGRSVSHLWPCSCRANRLFELALVVGQELSDAQEARRQQCEFALVRTGEPRIVRPFWARPPRAPWSGPADVQGRASESSAAPHESERRGLVDVAVFALLGDRQRWTVRQQRRRQRQPPTRSSRLGSLVLFFVFGLVGRRLFAAPHSFRLDVEPFVVRRFARPAPHLEGLADLADLCESERGVEPRLACGRRVVAGGSAALGGRDARPALPSPRLIATTGHAVPRFLSSPRQPGSRLIGTSDT